MRSDAFTLQTCRLLFRAALVVAAVSAGNASALAGEGRPARGGVGGPNFIDYIELTGLMDPALADFLSDQVKASEKAGSSALVVRVDSPGAVGVSAGRIAQTVRAARVPVVVWVAPGEAKAESASAYMAAAAHIAVMAPNATIGPASPGRVVNSATPASNRAGERRRLEALLSARLSPRDIAGLESRSFTAARAKRAGLVGFTAASLQELLQGLGSAEARDSAADRTRPGNGGDRVRALPEGPFTPRFHKMSVMGRLLHGSVRPPAAYLLLLGGVFLILFELYNPGVGGAAVSGGIAVGFSLYGLAILPTSWIGAGLVLVGLALFTIDLQKSTLGPVTAAGLGALLAGSIVMFGGAPYSMRLPWWAIVAGIASALAFFFSVMPAAIRSRIARPLAGAENIVGTHGVARTDVAPEGQVMARGTLWRARTLGAAIARGSSVEIRGVAGLTLMVEQAAQQVPESAHPPAGE